MNIDNTVYWILNDYHITDDNLPRSELWINDIYPIVDNDVNSAIDSVRDNISKSNGKYVVITDDINGFKELNRYFLSNNLVYVSGINSNDYNKDKVGNSIKWVFSDFGKENLVNDNVFFWSDPHFNHMNIIKYCNRPWNSGTDSNGELLVSDEDVKKMNDDLIERFNSVVPVNGLTWCLGDFCLGRNQNETIPEIVKKLHGKINLVMGNHDHHSVDFYYKAGFNRVYDRKIIINDFIILSHSPMEFVRAPFFNIFGHVHDCESYKTWSKDGCCVCVERHDYKPVSFNYIFNKVKVLRDE